MPSAADIGRHTRQRDTKTNGRKDRALICLAAGLLTVGVSKAAHSVECFPGPDFQPPPGTRWQYQTDSAKSQGCWHVQDLVAPLRRRTGEVARSSRSVSASSASERAAASGAPRSKRRELTPAVAPIPSINSWFSSDPPGLTNPLRAYSPTETDQDDTRNLPLTPRRRQNEATAPKKTERSRSEQHNKVAQRRQVREKTELEDAQYRYSISAVSVLEAAGDKPVPGLSGLMGQDLQKAMEAVGDKDVVTAPTYLHEDWQRALYEEFLQWRLKQVMP